MQVDVRGEGKRGSAAIIVTSRDSSDAESKEITKEIADV